MDATEKILNTSKTVYCDFFSNRPYSPLFKSHNMLKNEYLPPQRPSTMQTITRCGDNVIADIDNATGTVVRTYVTPMLDSNVSMTIAGATPTTYYYNQDERQSVMNLTDSTGTVSASYGYSAYGDKVDASTSGDVEQRYTYTGRELSAVSSDYYFRYRWYGAGEGGFYGRDTYDGSDKIEHEEEYLASRGVYERYTSDDRDFDPSTGRSWEYFDGMSLYTGYFTRRFEIDPKGNARATYVCAVGPIVTWNLRVLMKCNYVCQRIRCVNNGRGKRANDPSIPMVIRYSVWVCSKCPPAGFVIARNF